MSNKGLIIIGSSCTFQLIFITKGKLLDREDTHYIYLNGKGIRTIYYAQDYHMIVNLPMTARVFSFMSKLKPPL